MDVPKGVCWRLFALVTLMAVGALCQDMTPRCRDGQPPFRPQGGLSFCSDFREVSCCTANDDADIRRKYDAAVRALGGSAGSNCERELKRMMCAPCFPFAGQLYRMLTQGQTAREVPGLCGDYCSTIYSCRAIVAQLDVSQQVKDAAQYEQYFCDLYRHTDPSYCFPNALTDRRLLNAAEEAQEDDDQCYCLEDIKTNLRSPVALATIPGSTDNVVYVSDQLGVIRAFDASTGNAPTGSSGEVFLDISSRVSVSRNNYDSRKGVLGMAFHPSNGRVYVMYTEDADQTVRVKVSEFSYSGYRGDANSERVVLDITQRNPTRNGGGIVFGTDGYLYVPVGDDTEGDQAQNTTTLPGKVLRIDVTGRTDGPYTIPTNNPYYSTVGARREIYVTGVRDISACAVDSGDRNTGEGRGRIMCTDRGDGQSEINLLTSGGNYGWNLRDGNDCRSGKNCDNIPNEQRPAAILTSNDMRGGVFFRGCNNPELNGNYIFGNFVNGALQRLTSSGSVEQLEMCSSCSNGLINSPQPNLFNVGTAPNGDILTLTTNYPTPSWEGGRLRRLVNPKSYDPSRRVDPSTCGTSGGVQPTLRPAETTTTTQAPRPQPPSSRPRADVVFLMDSSTSIRQSGWDAMLDLIVDFINNQDNVRVGVVIFSAEARIEIPLNLGLSKGDLINRVRSIRYTAQPHTNTSGALNVMRSMGFSGAQRIGVLMTDGESTRDTSRTIPAGEAARADGFHMITIGFGPWISRRELESIASPPSSGNFFRVNNFRETTQVYSNISSIVVRIAPPVQVGPCDVNPCRNNGQCIVTSSQSFQCRCPAGYTGQLCDDTIVTSPCDNNQCQNGAQCQPLSGTTYECRCPSGYIGQFCERQQATSPCASAPCQNNAQCQEAGASFQCLCTTGYEGQRCETRSSKPGQCPTPQGVGICIQACNGDFDCAGSEKCCSNGCGNVCTVLSTCDSNPCQNGAACSGDRNTLLCTCLQGFTGVFCQDRITGPTCNSNPCQNGGQCNGDNDGYYCVCLQGYYGENCQVSESQLLRDQQCPWNPCDNSGTCIRAPTQRGYVCECPAGFYGSNCRQTVIDGRPMSQCDINPCLNGAGCVITPFEGIGYRCNCLQGYSGDFCQNQDGAPAHRCDNNPCQNAGICIREGINYRCDCAVGFSGTNCEIRDAPRPCASTPCINGGSCFDTSTSTYQCFCLAGFRGINCEIQDTTPCVSSPCRNGATCTNAEDTYQCTCAPGYIGTNCEQEEAVQVCDDSPCANGGRCINDGSSYRCECPQGYEGNDCERQVVVRGCQLRQCQNGATCVEGNFPPNEFRCDCPAGFQGTFCETQVTVLPCNSNPCVNGGACENTQNNGYVCRCPSGFQGRNCEQTVALPCDNSPCQNQGVCENLPNNDYACRCTASFQGRNCERMIESAPCENNPCLNGGMCMMRDEDPGYMCLCLPQFNGTNCERLEVVSRPTPCDIRPCRNGGQCVMWYIGRNVGYYCNCPTGTTGDNCLLEGQDDSTVCNFNPCENGGTCIFDANIPNLRYRCECAAGYTGTFCRARSALPCDSQPCFNNAVCRNLDNINYQCECPSGFSGRNCDESQRACDSQPCENGGSCYPWQNNPNQPYFCYCATGFMGQNCEQGAQRTCSSNPCLNGATCFDEGTGYRCQCNDGYVGRDCEMEACASAPCQNGGQCVPSRDPAGYYCNCPQGFDLPNCANRVQSACDSRPCQNGATCENNGNGYICRCTEGYEGNDCEIRIAIGICATNPCQNGGSCNRWQFPPGYFCFCISGYSGINCTESPRQPCDDQPCLNGGTCRNDGSNNFICACTAGYSGQTCATRTTDPFECEINPCQNQGTCRRNPSSRLGYDCFCPTGYSGMFCENEDRPCSSNPCLNGAECVETGQGSFRCNCPSGFSGRTCEISLPCASSPCQNGATCINDGNNFRCTCQTGFTGPTCGDRTPTGICSSVPCVNDGTCREVSNNFECDCAPGYSGRRCEITDFRPCDRNPCQFGTCIDRSFTYECQCDPGYTGTNCDQRLPEVSPCDSAPCQNDGTCVKVDANTYSCNCIAGYQGNNCQDVIVIEVNPCDSGPCLNGATCRKLDAQNYECDCLASFIGTNCQTPLPVISPCDNNPCQNGATCTNIRANQYFCRCVGDYEGINCERRITTSTTTTTTTTTTAAPASGAGDIMFILDSSGSVGLTNFRNRMLQFVEYVVDGLTIGSSDNQVGVITFSDRATTRFGLDAYLDKTNLINAIRNLPYDSVSSTNISGGVAQARRELLDATSGARSNYPKMCVALVDGESSVDSGNIPREAEALQRNGITCLVIGIGGWVRRSELRDIATDPDDDNLRFISSFRFLNRDLADYFITRINTILGVGPRPTIPDRTTPSTPTTTSSATTTTTRRAPTTTTDDIPDPCASNPCQNGADCIRGFARYTCDCTELYTGRNCERRKPTIPDDDFVYQCGFEEVAGISPWCDMIQATEDQLQWALSDKGRTPSEPTGPRRPFEGKTFAYMEASSPAQTNDRAKLILPFTSYSGEHCLVFAYNMFGFHIDSLYVQNGNDDIWMCSGEQGTDWRIANVQLDLRAGDEISLVAVRGTAFSADIAIDDVRLIQGQCARASSNCST